MPKKDGLQIFTPDSRRGWVYSVVATVMTTGLAIALLVRGEWLGGGILVAAVVIGWAGQPSRLWPPPPRGT